MFWFIKSLQNLLLPLLLLAVWTDHYRSKVFPCRTKAKNNNKHKFSRFLLIQDIRNYYFLRYFMLILRNVFLFQAQVKRFKMVRFQSLFISKVRGVKRYRMRVVRLQKFTFFWVICMQKVENVLKCLMEACLHMQSLNTSVRNRSTSGYWIEWF